MLTCLFPLGVLGWTNHYPRRLGQEDYTSRKSYQLFIHIHIFLVIQLPEKEKNTTWLLAFLAGIFRANVTELIAVTTLCAARILPLAALHTSGFY